jgi:hypothetical protein
MKRAAYWVVELLLVSSFSVGCQWHRVPNESEALGNEVSQAELTATGATSLYEALQRSRMRYFRPRGVVSFTNVPLDGMLVFRDGALMGTVEVLKTMRSSDVVMVRHLNSVETWAKYGRNVSIGGLEVELATR